MQIKASTGSSNTTIISEIWTETKWRTGLCTDKSLWKTWKEERDHSASLMVRDASFSIELAAGTTGMAQKCRNVYIGFRTTCAPTRVGRPIIFQQDNSKLHLISSLCSIVNKLWVYELCKLSCKCGKLNLTEFTFLAMCKLVRIISTVKVELQHVVCVQKH